MMLNKKNKSPKTRTDVGLIKRPKEQQKKELRGFGSVQLVTTATRTKTTAKVSGMNFPKYREPRVIKGKHKIRSLNNMPFSNLAEVLRIIHISTPNNSTSRVIRANTTPQ